MTLLVPRSQNRSVPICQRNHQKVKSINETQAGFHNGESISVVIQEISPLMQLLYPATPHSHLCNEKTATLVYACAVSALATVILWSVTERISCELKCLCL